MPASNHLLGFTFAGALGLVSLTVGCSSTLMPPIPQTPADAISNEFIDAPEWITAECNTYWDSVDEVRICAIGSVGGTTNASLARSTAVARGRSELARSLEVTVEAMLKDYQASATGGGGFGVLAADEQQITNVSKQVTETSLSGTEHSASWVSRGGTYYALVSLDVAKFSQVVAGMNTLSEDTRRAVSERAAVSFAELETETADAATPVESP